MILLLENCLPQARHITPVFGNIPKIIPSNGIFLKMLISLPLLNCNLVLSQRGQLASPVETFKWDVSIFGWEFMKF